MNGNLGDAGRNTYRVTITSTAVQPSCDPRSLPLLCLARRRESHSDRFALQLVYSKATDGCLRRHFGSLSLVSRAW